MDMPDWLAVLIGCAVAGALTYAGMVYLVLTH